MERPTATVTQRDQWMVESEVFGIYGRFGSLPPKAQSVMIELQRDSHIEYLTRGLRGLPSSFSVLDANRPWLCYWILHSLALLGESIDDELERNAIDFLTRCQDPEGGYGGGPGQMPHLATTYAAVNALITLGGDEALSSINRGELYKFLWRMKHPSGGFRMHDGGEIDVRACYTAVSVASILNILDDELVHNVGSFILSCQTYEGGISGEPGAEAHGGYVSDVHVKFFCPPVFMFFPFTYSDVNGSLVLKPMVHFLWGSYNGSNQSGQSFGLSWTN